MAAPIFRDVAETILNGEWELTSAALKSAREAWSTGATGAARIGSGGMADVWLADDTHLQRRVALKVLHARFAQDREFVERFRREAEAAAGLQHPNIVAVFDRGEVDGTYYIAMQYLRGAR